MNLVRYAKRRARPIVRAMLEYAGVGYHSHLALNDLDHKLEHYLPYRGGFFVELGANDGYSQSNTYFFEKVRRWRGILIEPIPDLYRLAVERRRRSRVFNCACVPFDYPDTHIKMTYSHLMSLVEGALRDPEKEAEHIATGDRIQGVQSYTLSAPVRTLTSILDECRVKKIDLLSLDVEGFEGSVLRGLDMTRYTPHYMLIEVRFKDEIDDLLAPRYDCIAQLSELDYLYRLKGLA
ncbi:MAG: FkbM family methyltransferase [Anaerolineae bacterium]|nr:FkbM family methyltransferase [Anaerolineae bacterium]